MSTGDLSDVLKRASATPVGTRGCENVAIVALAAAVAGWGVASVEAWVPWLYSTLLTVLALSLVLFGTDGALSVVRGVMSKLRGKSVGIES